jgi:hypothetical protein
MAYMHRTYAIRRSATSHKRTGTAELVCLFIVLAAAVGTAYWFSHQGRIDLSGINTAASVLGLTESDRHTAVGYVSAAPDTASSAPYCSPGQLPAFSSNALALEQQVGGEAMGAPLECEHAESQTGDLIQQTTTGLVAYDKLRDTVSFTDGWRHWAITPNGTVAWEGTDSAPPSG